MSQRFFISSSGTGVGKTLVTATLAHQLLAKGKSVSALKPIISGYDANDANSDTALLLKSQNLPATKPNVEAISPWRFAAPVAPSVAAVAEGKTIEFSELVDFCNLPRTSEVTLIEGAGGVMVPLTHTHTILDWIEACKVPVILVVGTYLGAISHALTAGEALRARNVRIQAVVVSESAEGAMSAEATARELQPFMSNARYIVPLPRVAGNTDLWQDVADLTWILL